MPVLCLAGAVGIEPTIKVLETSVIPLHHAPIINNLTQKSVFVNPAARERLGQSKFLQFRLIKQEIFQNAQPVMDAGPNSNLRGLGKITGADGDFFYLNALSH